MNLPNECAFFYGVKFLDDLRRIEVVMWLCVKHGGKI